MRLSEWRKAAPTKDAMSNRVLAVLKPVLADLGTDDDPESWVEWGDDPAFRYSVMAPTLTGLAIAAVRPSGPEDGPRVTAKVVRWSKLAISELSVEASGGHRIVAVQVEGQVLKGIDDEADRICGFVRNLIAAVDNRNPQALLVPAVSAAARSTVAAEPPRAALARAPRTAPKPKALPKPARKPLHVVPAAAATAPEGKTPSKPAATKPAEPKGAPVAPEAPKPIAARTSARRQGSASTAGAAPGASTALIAGPTRVEPEPDRSEWVGPHPIEEPPVRDPNRPRPWTP
jgi:hypothetical protein